LDDSRGSSGGRWTVIRAVGHPDVAEAAVIGLPHPKWDERPLLVVVAREDKSPSKEDILGFMEGKIARWWMPDDVAFVDEIPHTATGKIQKTTLRDRFAGYRLPA
jgi:fatty-acyl-CoA synthase